MTRETLSKWFLYTDLWNKDARRDRREIELCSSVAPPLRDWQGRPPMTDSASYWLMQKPTNQIPFHCRRHLWFPPRSGAFLDSFVVCFLSEWYSLWKSHSALRSISAVCVCVCFIRLSDAVLCLVKLYWLKNRLVCFIRVMIRSAASLPCVCRAETTQELVLLTSL